MIDWFKYYQRKFLRSGKSMAKILVKARTNPFCDEEVIIKLCDWLDEDTEKRSGFKLPYRNSYNLFIKVEGDA